MKKLIVVALGVFTSIAVFAQTESMADWSPEIYQVGKIYPGYIVKLDGDTIQGFIKAGNRCSLGGIGNSNQNQAVFYLHSSDKKPAQKYKPKDIKGYKIADKIYESIAYSGGLLKTPNFNLVIQDGAIRLYEWYATVDGYSTIRKQSGETWKKYDSRRFDTNVIVAKNPTEPIEISLLGLSFVKKMPSFVSDNPEMIEKINNKEKGYKFINIYDVIEEYNQWSVLKKK